MFVQHGHCFGYRAWGNVCKRVQAPTPFVCLFRKFKLATQELQQETPESIHEPGLAILGQYNGVPEVGALIMPTEVVCRN
jgi:hypothetical protein